MSSITEKKFDLVERKPVDYLAEFQKTKELCKQLMQTSHYSKLQEVGVFAIVEAAKSLNIDPRLALGGGLYFVKGKVEMSSRMMAALIRKNKHSITRDPKSDDTVCILHGKRSDTGDTWTESFSMDEASKAGISGNDVWKKFPRDMLYARALSRLARQLFPDVIGNCYVEGEIALDPSIKDEMPNPVIEIPPVKINDEQIREVSELILETDSNVEKFLKWLNVSSIGEMTLEDYEKAIAMLTQKLNKNIEVVNAHIA